MMTIEDVKDYLKNYKGSKISLMEVCGSHTRAIVESGIEGMISGRINLVSGPGCPVCVTPSSYIDRLIELGRDNVIVTFGDLIRVPGSRMSLSMAKSQGVKVEMVYSPFDVLRLAEADPGERFVFAAVGFETTAPAFAALVSTIISREIKNIRLLTAIKTMPPVIDHLMKGGADIDGFLAPGHVSVVIGSDAYAPLAARYGIPFVVSGFSGRQLLVALYDLVRSQGRGTVINDYPSVVSSDGNTDAWREVLRIFEADSAVWRGIGRVDGSALVLKAEYDWLDAGSRYLEEDIKLDHACICDKVLVGKKRPSECPLFGRGCTPNEPRGACMVSGEGSCFSHYVNNHLRVKNRTDTNG